MRGSTQLHDIVRSEAYSEEEFLAAVEHLGMNWYVDSFNMMKHIRATNMHFQVIVMQMIL